MLTSEIKSVFCYVKITECAASNAQMDTRRQVLWGHGHYNSGCLLKVRTQAIDN